jgi:hypothetical protein
MRLNHPHSHDRDLMAIRTILSASGPMVAYIAEGDLATLGPLALKACLPIDWVRGSTTPRPTRCLASC